MTTVFKNMDKILVLKSDERFGEDSLLLAWQYLRHSVWRVLPPLLFGNTKATFSQATLVRLVNGHWKEVGEASCSPSEFFVRSVSVPLSTPDTHSQTSTTEMPRNKKGRLKITLSSSRVSFHPVSYFSHSLFSPAESFLLIPEPSIFVCEYSEISPRDIRARETARTRDSKRAP